MWSKLGSCGGSGARSLGAAGATVIITSRAPVDVRRVADSSMSCANVARPDIVVMLTFWPSTSRSSRSQPLSQITTSGWICARRAVWYFGISLSHVADHLNGAPLRSMGWPPRMPQPGTDAG